MKLRGKLNLTTKYVIGFGALMLAANILLGIVLFNQSRASLRVLLEKNMLDITNTAAGMMDGDRLGALTEADVGGDYFREVIRTLTVFQERVEIEFIYAVKQVGPEDFVFTVDPDPVDPGAFGEPVLVTPALIEAGKGVATVDSAAAADRWGSFYSAYSPVLDSSGAVAGIIGVDFDADWYEQQLHRISQTVVLVSALTILIGVAVIALITQRTHVRFRELGDELSVLSGDIDELTEVITSNPGYMERRGADAAACAPSAGDTSRDDELGALRGRIHVMESDLHGYLDYLHAQANTDALTGIGNSTAYLERIETLSPRMAAGDCPPCAVAVFDIDLLKHVNDTYGHAAGDMIIRAAASVISRVFGRENVFRIGGDEFLVIAEGLTEEEMAARLERVEAAAPQFTMPDRRVDGLLSLSGGAAAYRPGEDKRFRDIFVRADQAMYRRKNEHHARA